MFITVLGILAAVSTSAANLPQVVKCWRSGETDALSAKMLALLTFGFACWIGYGFFRGDLVIVVANLVSIVLSVFLLVLKARNGWN